MLIFNRYGTTSLLNENYWRKSMLIKQLWNSFATNWTVMEQSMLIEQLWNSVATHWTVIKHRVCVLNSYGTTFMLIEQWWNNVATYWTIKQRRLSLLNIIRIATMLIAFLLDNSSFSCQIIFHCQIIFLLSNHLPLCNVSNSFGYWKVRNGITSYWTVWEEHLTAECVINYLGSWNTRIPYWLAS